MLKLDKMIGIVAAETTKAVEQSAIADKREIRELETRIKEQKS